MCLCSGGKHFHAENQHGKAQLLHRVCVMRYMSVQLYEFQRHYQLKVYVTACDPEKSFTFNTTAENVMYVFQFTYNKADIN